MIIPSWISVSGGHASNGFPGDADALGLREPRFEKLLISLNKAKKSFLLAKK